MNKNKSKLKLKNKSKSKSKLKKNTKIKSKKYRSYKSKMVGGALPMKVISYNISWGAMSGNVNDFTARRLARHCRDVRPRPVADETVCLTNVRTFLEAEYDKGRRLAQPQAPIGFIALQEAMNWKNIICRSDRLSNMGYVHHDVRFVSGGRTIYADLCTLYNQNLFKLLGVICGNINKDGTDGRPYHKLFLESIGQPGQPAQPVEKFIFINFHNSQPHIIRSRVEFETALNDQDQVVIDVHQTNEIHFENITESAFRVVAENIPENPFQVYALAENIPENAFRVVALNEFIQTHGFLENSRIIMAGDTNDSVGINFWQGMTPFIQTPGLDTIQVNTKTIPPPRTCCVGERSLRKKRPIHGEDTFYGDYIMISQNLNYLTHGSSSLIPRDFNILANRNPTSDHLPVVATIT
jgi:hypothetical protein